MEYGFLRLMKQLAGDILRRMHEQQWNIGDIALQAGLNIANRTEREAQPLIEADSALRNLAANRFHFQNDGQGGLRKIRPHDMAADSVSAGGLADGKMFDKIESGKLPVCDKTSDFALLRVHQYPILVF